MLSQESGLRCVFAGLAMTCTTRVSAAVHSSNEAGASTPWYPNGFLISSFSRCQPPAFRHVSKRADPHSSFCVIFLCEVSETYQDDTRMACFVRWALCTKNHSMRYLVTQDLLLPQRNSVNGRMTSRSQSLIPARSIVLTHGTCPS